MEKAIVSNTKLQNTSNIRHRQVISLPSCARVIDHLYVSSVFYFTFISFLFFTDDLRDFNLPASATSTDISNLTPDIDYSVSISSYDGVEESIPIFGQITSKYQKYKILSDLILVICASKIGKLY